MHGSLPIYLIYFMSAMWHGLKPGDHILIQTIKSLAGNKNGIELPPCIVKDSHNISDRYKMLGCFNEYFIASGSLYDSLNNTHENPSNGCSDGHVTVSQSFSFNPVTVSEVHKALKRLDTRKSAGPDNL